MSNWYEPSSGDRGQKPTRPDPYRSPKSDSDSAPLGPGETIDTNMFGAVAATLCLCWPLGIVSIIYASQVNACLLKGDVAGARRASQLSKNWMMAAIFGGILAIIVYFVALSAEGGF